MKVKKRTLWIMLIGGATLVSLGAKIIYTYFSVSKHPRAPEDLVLGIIVSVIGVILGIISFLSDAY